MYRTPRSEANLGELLGRLTDNVGKLLRQEVRLAQADVRDNATRMGIDAACIATGGIITFAGMLNITAGMSMLLGKVLPRWLAAVIMGGTLVGGGLFLIDTGRKALQNASRDTFHTLQADAGTIRQGMG